MRQKGWVELRERIDFWPFHPRRSKLQGFFDRQLDEAGSRRIALHLKACLSCRTKMEQLRKTWELLGALAEIASLGQNQVLQQGLSNLRTRIQFLKPLSRPHSELNPSLQEQRVLSRQIAKELGIYLGPRLASALFEPLKASEGESRMSLEEAEAMLASFLGNRAVSEIIERLLLVGQDDPGSISETELVQNLV